MPGNDNFLSRWSRRKSASQAASREQPSAVIPSPVDPAQPPVDPAPSERAPLPSVESLTPDSDFSPFMSPEVDGDVRRKALKTLFSDPRFNTMDMMDVYVDDYSKPDPIPAAWMDKLEQLSRLGDRAGRDREEAERKARAEAEAAARAADAPPDPAGNSGPLPPPVDAPAQAPAAEAIPASKVGDSST